MQQWHRILENKGGKVAEEAKLTLLNDPALRDLKTPLEFISRNWHDPLRPALMALSCEAVGGRQEDTKTTALAISLMNLSFFIWDDMVDKASSRLFKPTFYGKFGEGTTLIVGGLASAKAFLILNNQTLGEEKKRKNVSKLVWSLWAKTAKAEIINFKSRNEKYSSRDKFWKIKSEAVANLATCLKIGAVIGNGSKNEIMHLGKYGLYLGILLDLQNDFLLSTNLTLELEAKLKTGVLPYSLLWAKEHSEKTKRILNDICKKNEIDPNDLERIVASTLETDILNRTKKSIERLAKKAGGELVELPKNEGTQALKSFVEAQPQLFEESLPN